MKKILIMCAALMGMLVFTGCSDSPRDVAVKWGNAILEGDAKKANEYSTQRAQVITALAVGMCSDEKGKAEIRKSIEEWKNGKEEITGDTAKVGDKDPITLKKVDGKWKVDVEKKNQMNDDMPGKAD